MTGALANVAARETGASCAAMCVTGALARAAARVGPVVVAAASRSGRALVVLGLELWTGAPSAGREDGCELVAAAVTPAAVVDAAPVLCVAALPTLVGTPPSAPAASAAAPRAISATQNTIRTGSENAALRAAVRATVRSRAHEC